MSSKPADKPKQAANPAKDSNTSTAPQKTQAVASATVTASSATN